jgi:HK97 family phage portal protein
MFKFLKALMPKAQDFVINGSKDVQPAGNGSKSAGMTVTTTYAMRLSAVYACVRLISQTIGTLPFRVYEELPDGNRKIAKDYPLDKLINRKPNADSTASLFWGSVVSAILLRGGAHVRVLKVGERIVGLVFLNPDRLSSQKINGVKTWYYAEADGTTTKLTDKNVVYFPGFSIDGVCGLSAIEYGASVFGNAMAANAAANGSFENGLQPTMYIKQEGIVKKEQRAEFRESMSTVLGAVNAGTPVVLEGGQSIGTIGINQKDAQLLESRQFSIEEICRWFGVSPHMIGHSSTSVWGAGFEQQMIGTLTFTFAPHLTCIAQVVNCFIIPLKDQDRYYAEHVTQGLMRADSTARAAYYSQMVNNGMMTRAEVRRLENLDDKGGKSDLLTVQLALTPLDKLGEQNAQTI